MAITNHGTTANVLNPVRSYSLAAGTYEETYFKKGEKRYPPPKPLEKPRHFNTEPYHPGLETTLDWDFHTK